VKPSQNQGTIVRCNCSTALLRVSPFSVCGGTENLPPPVGSAAPRVHEVAQVRPHHQMALKMRPFSTGNGVGGSASSSGMPPACWRKQPVRDLHRQVLVLEPHRVVARRRHQDRLQVLQRRVGQVAIGAAKRPSPWPPSDRHVADPVGDGAVVVALVAVGTGGVAPALLKMSSV